MCLKDFGNRKDNYQSHITKISGCGAGITKLDEMKKQNEKKDINILRLKEENDKLVDEDKKLKDENEKLKEEIENLKKQAIIFNDNSTNITNNFILQINNFDDTKCEVVIQNLLKYMGKSIYIKTVEDIYLNNSINHNIYM